MDAQGSYLIANIEMTGNRVPNLVPPEEKEDNQWIEFGDDISGKPLNGQSVRKARDKEVEYIRKSKLYDIVPLSDCFRDTGKKPIAGRWVDINKGDLINEIVRSRWVAKDFKRGINHELFAATPPLEALRIIICQVATSSMDNKRMAGNKRLLIMDVSRAFFYAPVEKLT